MNINELLNPNFINNIQISNALILKQNEIFNIFNNLDNPTIDPFKQNFNNHLYSNSYNYNNSCVGIESIH